MGGGFHGPPFASSRSPSGLVTGRSRGPPGRTPASTVGSRRSAPGLPHTAEGTERSVSVSTNGPVAQRPLDHPARRKGHIWFHVEGVCWTGQQAVGKGSPDAEATGGGLSGRREAREQQGLVATGVLTPHTPATHLIGLPAHRWSSDPGKREWVLMREPHMMWVPGPIPSPGTGNAGQGHPGRYKTIRIQGSEVRKHFQTFMGLRGSDHCKILLPTNIWAL